MGGTSWNLDLTVKCQPSFDVRITLSLCRDIATHFDQCYFPLCIHIQYDERKTPRKFSDKVSNSTRVKYYKNNCNFWKKKLKSWRLPHNLANCPIYPCLLLLCPLIEWSGHILGFFLSVSLFVSLIVCLWTLTFALRLILFENDSFWLKILKVDLCHTQSPVSYNI